MVCMVFVYGCSCFCICSFLCQVMQQRARTISCFLFACHGCSLCKISTFMKRWFFFLAQALECYIKAWFRKHPPACQVTQQWCPRPRAWKRDRKLQRNGVELVPTGQDDREDDSRRAIFCQHPQHELMTVCTFGVNMCILVFVYLHVCQNPDDGYSLDHSFSFWEHDQPPLRYSEH